MTDTDLTRLLAERVMGWAVYRASKFTRPYRDWQVRLIKGRGANTCFIDNDGRIWRYDGTELYTTGMEREWRPLQSMDDAMQIVEHLKNRSENRYWCEMRTPFQDGDRYMAGFTIWAFTGWNGRPDVLALADSLPRAICEAARKIEVSDA